MMKAKLSHLALFLTVSILSTAPLFARAPDTLWTRTYGDSGISAAYGVAQLPGGGFMVGGYTPHDVGLQSDMWLFRVNADGNMVWEDKIGLADRHERAYTLEPALDGEFVLAGELILGDTTMQAYIVKADSNGSGWGFFYGSYTEDTYAYDAVATPYGGVLAVGHQTLNNAGHNVYMVGTFPNGMEMFHNFFHWGWSEKAFGIDRTSDGGYIVTGETNSFGLHSYGIFLQKLDSLALETGFVLITWEGDQYGKSVQQTLDGGYIVVGSRQLTSPPDLDMVIIKTDPSGIEEWRKIYGGASHDVATDVQVLPDGGYIVTGVGRKPSTLHSDVWVLRLDANGDTLWTKFIGAELIGTRWINESSYQIRCTADGGYIIAGARGVGYWDTRAYLIRLAPDPEGIVDNKNNRIPEEFALSQNYPNPFNATTVICYSLPVDRYQSSADGGPRTAVSLEVYNILGEKVATLVDEKQTPGYKAVTWDAKDAGSGIYFYRLQAEGFVETRKMILLK